MSDARERERAGGEANPMEPMSDARERERAGGEASQSASMSIEVGDPAPDFELTDQHLERIRLSDFRGKRNTLLVFYPLTFTSVCGGELTALRDRLPELEASEVTVLGISTDSSAVHRTYVDREYLGFQLLSDFWPHGAVAQAYGVFDETTGLAERASFLIDMSGVIRWSVATGNSTPRSTEDYLTASASL